MSCLFAAFTGDLTRAIKNEQPFSLGGGTRLALDRRAAWSMPKVSEAHLDARRKQIVDAAVACFARNGFHRATMQDICREAELSPGAVYRYFSSKDELVEAIADERHAREAEFAAGARDI